MNPKIFLALGALIVLLIGVIIGLSIVLLMQRTDTDIHHTGTVTLKIPPEGETFATGHWDDDTWHRTVPPNPETITYNGEKLRLEKFSDAVYEKARGTYTKSLKERLAMLRHIIAEAPYSLEANHARRELVEYDENGERIHDDVVLFERLELLIKYDPNNPGLLKALLVEGWNSHPETATRYGKEALKYINMYPVYQRRFEGTTEIIHKFLGYAYEEIGDYDAALEHYNQALVLSKSNPASWLDFGAVLKHIERIKAGDPMGGGNPPEKAKIWTGPVPTDPVPTTDD